MRGAGLGAGSTHAFSVFLSNLPGVGLEIHALPVSETRLDWRLNEDTTSLNNKYSHKIFNDNNTFLYRVPNGPGVVLIILQVLCPSVFIKHRGLSRAVISGIRTFQI